MWFAFCAISFALLFSTNACTRTNITNLNLHLRVSNSRQTQHPGDFEMDLFCN